MNENVIEWIRGDDTAKVTAPSGSRLKGKIMRLAKLHPDEVRVIDENDDGSIFAEIPVKYVKVSPPRKMSEEQKEAASKRFKEMWENKSDAVED